MTAMIFLITLLLLALTLFLIGFWATHRYPALRPYRYSNSSEIHLPEARKTSLHITLLNQYQLQRRIREIISDAEKVLYLTKWVHSLWQPMNKRSARSDNPLAIISRAAKGERFNRDAYVIVLAHALMALDIPVRLVTLCTRDFGYRPLASQYCGIEYFDRDLLKWVWLDGRLGVRVMHNFKPLSAMEIKNACLHKYLLDLDSDIALDCEVYTSQLARFLDILIVQPIGQHRRFALVPPQLKIWKHKWGMGKKLFDVRCYSLQAVYASPPIKHLVKPNQGLPKTNRYERTLTSVGTSNF